MEWWSRGKNMTLPNLEEEAGVSEDIILGTDHGDTDVFLLLFKLI